MCEREESPTLLSLSAQAVCAYIIEPNLRFGHVYLNDNVTEVLLQTLRQRKTIHDGTLAAFGDSESCNVARVNLDGCTWVTDVGLEAMVAHPLTELRLTSCYQLTHAPLLFPQLCDSLRFLVLRGCLGMNPLELSVCLQRLTMLTNLDLSGLPMPYDLVISVSQLPHLMVLSLSNCQEFTDAEFQLLAEGSIRDTLRSLCVSGTDITEQSVGTIMRFCNIESLDLSKNERLQGHPFFHPLAELPHLQWLNLNRTGVLTEDLHPLLQAGRLRFLGLCQTKIRSLPVPVANPQISSYPRARQTNQTSSLMVAGYFNIESLVTALQVYGDDEECVYNALKSLFTLYRQRPPKADNGMAKLILDVMERHINDVRVQIGASASVYHLTKQAVRGQTAEGRLHAIRVLTRVMEVHMANFQLQKNVCLTLCNFNIQHELEVEYARVVDLLLQSAIQHRDDLIQRIAIALSNGLVCLGIAQKANIGRRGVIRSILDIIRLKIANNEMDAALETAWSALWNVTDETPQNCELFLQENGMDVFMEVMGLYPNEGGLVRNMLGLIGNVAEVDYLRPLLMKDEVLLCLSNLLDSNQEGIEVSYNSSGVIANLASEGPEFWATHTRVDRAMVLGKMVHAIERWQIQTTRSINYRSLKPIVRLAKCSHCPEVQHWAAWALANLCTVYPAKYCVLLLEEDQVDGIETLLVSSSAFVRRMAQLAYTEIVKYQNDPTLRNEAMQMAANETLPPAFLP